jgi:hypothetical protein
MSDRTSPQSFRSLSFKSEGNTEFCHITIHHFWKFQYLSLLYSTNTSSFYGLIMTVKEKQVSISYEYTCKIIFDGAQYGLLLLLLCQ